jgi:hypothetical protein
MVIITGKNLLLVAAVIIGAAPFTSAQRLYDDGSLSLRDFYDDHSDLSARSYNEPLSIREYIDDQIELALREYDDVFDELVARHTQKEIDDKIKYWQKAERDARKNLKPAQDKQKAAKKALDKDPNNKDKKRAYKRAGDELDTVRGAMGAAEDELVFWRKQKAS